MTEPVTPDFAPCGLAGRELAGSRRFCRDENHPDVVTAEICHDCPLKGCEKPPREKRKPIPPGADLRCVYRGAVLRTEKCQLCGEKEKLAEIFSCSLHGECSLHRFKNGKGPTACLSCRDRTAELVQLGAKLE